MLSGQIAITSAATSLFDSSFSVDTKNESLSLVSPSWNVEASWKKEIEEKSDKNESVRHENLREVHHQEREANAFRR